VRFLTEAYGRFALLLPLSCTISTKAAKNGRQMKKFLLLFKVLVIFTP